MLAIFSDLTEAQRERALALLLQTEPHDPDHPDHPYRAISPEALGLPAVAFGRSDRAELCILGAACCAVGVPDLNYYDAYLYPTPQNAGAILRPGAPDERYAEAIEAMGAWARGDLATPAQQAEALGVALPASGAGRPPARRRRAASPAPQSAAE